MAQLADLLAVHAVLFSFSCRHFSIFKSITASPALSVTECTVVRPRCLFVEAGFHPGRTPVYRIATQATNNRLQTSHTCFPDCNKLENTEHAQEHAELAFKEDQRLNTQVEFFAKVLSGRLDPMMIHLHDNDPTGCT